MAAPAPNLTAPLNPDMDRESTLNAILNDAQSEPDDDRTMETRTSQPASVDAIQARSEFFSPDDETIPKGETASFQSETPPATATPGQGDGQQSADGVGGEPGPVPYSRFKEINDQLGFAKVERDELALHKPVLDAVQKFFGVSDPALITQALAHVEEQKQQAAIEAAIKQKWEENAAVLGDEAANRLEQSDRLLLQVQQQANANAAQTRTLAVKQTYDDLSKLMPADPVVQSTLREIVDASPTEYLPTLKKQMETLATTIKNDAIATYAARKEADGTVKVPVSPRAGNPPQAPGKPRQDTSANPDAGWRGFGSWLNDMRSGGGTA